MSKHCKFCNAVETKANPIYFKYGFYICNQCIASSEIVMQSNLHEDDLFANSFSDLSPKILKQKLDEYVIGQERAKRMLSVAIYNHYKRITSRYMQEDSVEIQKSNILLIGPTGSGKTLMAQTFARFLDIPIAIADATSLTEAGYVGEDVENIITKLYQAADYSIEKTQIGIVFVDEIDKIARLSENRSITRDVSGEGVQQALLKIIEGSIVNISPKGGRKHPNQDFIQINTENILFICAGAFDGLKDIIKRRFGKNVLGFNSDKNIEENKKDVLNLVDSEDLVSYGMIPEFVGRLHVVTTLEEISIDAMINILLKPKNSIINQYKKIFALDNVELEFENKAIKLIAQMAYDKHTGARGLRSIIENIMVDLMFNIKDYEDCKLIITSDFISAKNPPMLIKKNSTKQFKNKIKES